MEAKTAPACVDEIDDEGDEPWAGSVDVAAPAGAASLAASYFLASLAASYFLALFLPQEHSRKESTVAAARLGSKEGGGVRARAGECDGAAE